MEMTLSANPRVGYTLKRQPSPLPTFPEFTPLRLGHRPIITQFTKRFPPFADYTFVSLYSWNIRKVVALSSLFGNLVVRFSDDLTDDTYLSFLGTHKLGETIEALLGYTRFHGYNSHLLLIPAPVIKYMPPGLRNQYDIKEDRDNHDYMLSVHDLSQFDHPKLRQRRANYNKFVQIYGDRSTCDLIDLTAPGMTDEVEDLLLNWRYARGKSADTTRNEFQAIHRCLQHSERLGVQAFGTYLDGKLIALNIFEIVDDMAIGHFMKVNTKFRGVSEHMVHVFSKYLETQGVTHINIQQDVGIQGLRAYKLSYRPEYFLKKYSIGRP